MRSITVTVISVVTASMLASADRSGMKEDLVAAATADVDGDLSYGYFVKLANYLFQTDGSGYQHVWPVSIFLSISHLPWSFFHCYKVFWMHTLLNIQIQTADSKYVSDFTLHLLHFTYHFTLP